MFDTLRNWNAVSVPSAWAPSLTVIFIGCRGDAVVNSSSRVYSKQHRPPGVQRGEGDQILGDHFLLAAEAAADPFAEHAQLVGTQIEQVGRA